MENKIKIKEIEYGSEEYEKTIDLRNEYFRKPQGLDIRDEDLSADKSSHMYGAFIDDELIGTVFYTKRDISTAQIKAVIVDEKFQGLHLGQKLMNFAEDKIKKEEVYSRIYLTARVKVEGFYEKLGYKTISLPFDYNTIPHIEMEKFIK